MEEPSHENPLQQVKVWKQLCANSNEPIPSDDSQPSYRQSCVSAIYDNRLFIFGGNHGEKAKDCLNDLWMYPLNISRNSGRKRDWKKVAINSTSVVPEKRGSMGDAIVYKDKMYIFAGNSASTVYGNMFCFSFGFFFKKIIFFSL